MNKDKSLKAAWAHVDPLGEVLHSLRMSSTFYCRSEFTAPWGLNLPEMDNCLMFHIVTEGCCWVELDGAEDCLLQTGEFALVPHGNGHRLTGKPGSETANLFDLPRKLISPRYELLRHGGGGDATTIICGAVRLEHPVAQRIIELLPEIIVIKTGSIENEWIQSTLRLMVSEAKAMRIGGDAVITRISDILVIQAIRTWLESAPTENRGWFAALQDVQIGRAIGLIHHDPNHDWTLETLANEVGMSRSGFAARFMTMVGEPPVQYVRRWRMHEAESLLKESSETVSELAYRFGYQSEAAFSRAFKKCIGVSPGSVRKRHQLQMAKYDDY